MIRISKNQWTYKTYKKISEPTTDGLTTYNYLKVMIPILLFLSLFVVMLLGIGLSILTGSDVLLEQMNEFMRMSVLNLAFVFAVYIISSNLMGSYFPNKKKLWKDKLNRVLTQFIAIID